MENLKTFYSEKLGPILGEFSRHHLELILVGGAVRDYMLNGSLSTDCDLEIISSKATLSLEEAIDCIESVLKKIIGNNVERLPFHIYRFSYGGLDCEISIGREEEFVSDEVGHKNFNPIFLLNNDFNRKWQRRDFSINAMGINLSTTEKKVNLIDPFLGKKDISAKKLRPCSDQFTRDPVRLLRLVRFHLLYDLEISKSIQMQQFNLSAVSFYYLRKEGERVNFSSFLKTLLGVVYRFNVKTNDFVEMFGVISEKMEFQSFHHLIYLLAKNTDSEIIEFIFTNGLFSKKKFKKLKKFHEVKNLEARRLFIKEELGHFYPEFLKWCHDDC